MVPQYPYHGTPTSVRRSPLRTTCAAANSSASAHLSSSLHLQAAAEGLAAASSAAASAAVAWRTRRMRAASFARLTLPSSPPPSCGRFVPPPPPRPRAAGALPFVPRTGDPRGGRGRRVGCPCLGPRQRPAPARTGPCAAPPSSQGCPRSRLRRACARGASGWPCSCGARQRAIRAGFRRGGGCAAAARTREAHAGADADGRLASLARRLRARERRTRGPMPTAGWHL